MQQAEAIHYNWCNLSGRLDCFINTRRQSTPEMNIQPSSGEINAAELVSVMELKTPVVLPGHH